MGKELAVQDESIPSTCTDLFDIGFGKSSEAGRHFSRSWYLDRIDEGGHVHLYAASGKVPD